MRESVYSFVIAFCVFLAMPFGAAMAETGVVLATNSIDGAGIASKVTDNVSKDAQAVVLAAHDTPSGLAVAVLESNEKVICLSCHKETVDALAVASLAFGSTEEGAGV